jgi:hypothetical protein
VPLCKDTFITAHRVALFPIGTVLERTGKKHSFF